MNGKTATPAISPDSQHPTHIFAKFSERSTSASLLFRLLYTRERATQSEKFIFRDCHSKERHLSYVYRHTL